MIFCLFLISRDCVSRESNVSRLSSSVSVRWMKEWMHPRFNNFSHLIDWQYISFLLQEGISRTVLLLEVHDGSAATANPAHIRFIKPTRTARIPTDQPISRRIEQGRRKKPRFLIAVFDLSTQIIHRKSTSKRASKFRLIEWRVWTSESANKRSIERASTTKQI